MMKRKLIFILYYLIIYYLKKNINLYNNINNNIKIKFEYIIEKLVDLSYYYHQISEYNLNKLKEILKYYKDYLFESKKEDINIISNIINNKKSYNKKYLENYEKSTYINKRSPIIKYLYNNNKINNEEEKEINKCIEKWNIYENMIKSNNIKNIDNSDKLILIEYFKNKDNKDILKHIFLEEVIDNFISNNENYNNIMKELESSLLKVKNNKKKTF